MNPNENTTTTTFEHFDLPDTLKMALAESGYEIPTPIQEKMIPVVLTGKDVLGQAQTGTGKTAAFALPLLSKIDLERKEPQILVLTPTRELAIQVSEAFKKYGAHLPGLNVLAVYGGQDYSIQLRGLKRGAHVVVGTPGRVMDHIDRTTLNLEKLSALVLDEADEMLKMGFKEDVEFVLEHTPDDRQIALFSATLPAPIRAIAKKYLKDPVEIIIKNKTSTVELTRQRYWMVSRLNKLDALSRILEVETYDAVLIFVRTKAATLEVSEQLEGRGFAVAALNGDIQQKQREKTIEQLKSGKLNIVIATDVAARGLDVERISHVINYDIPNDPEVYIHRIGRTGRAGRSGEAILFASNRELRALQIIERVTRQKIEQMEVPTIDEINSVRIMRFKKRISDTLAREEWKAFRDIMENFIAETEAAPLDVASALAVMFHGDRPFFLTKSVDKFENSREKADFSDRPRGRRSTKSDDFGRNSSFSSDSDSNNRGWEKKRERSRPEGEVARPRRKRNENGQEEGKITYQIEVGHFHGVHPGQIMGAIAGETGIQGQSIGRITIYEDFSTVDLPDTMTETMLNKLQRVKIVGRPLMLEKHDPTRTGETSREKIRESAREKPRESFRDRKAETTRRRTAETPTDRTADDIRETSHERSGEAPRRRTHETSREKPRETSHDRTRDTSRERPRETSHDRTRDTSREKPRETSHDRTRDTSRERPRETSHDRTRDTSRERPRETSRNRAGETSPARSRGASHGKESEMSGDRKRSTERKQSSETRFRR
ncbi:MAG: DEAD/DEAH box helicase [Candidatus Riflebacteria bacterium]|nr:DEAD/DEAH box helicase [Candidatus Riflebacteria bacterium]